VFKQKKHSVKPHAQSNGTSSSGGSSECPLAPRNPIPFLWREDFQGFTIIKDLIAYLASVSSFFHYHKQASLRQGRHSTHYRYE